MFPKSFGDVRDRSFVVIVAGISHAWRTGETIDFRVLFVGFVVFTASTTVSFLTLLTLAISQLLAIGWVQRYERCVSNRSAKIGIGVIWTITIILCVALAIVTVWLVIWVMLFEVTLITIESGYHLHRFLPCLPQKSQLPGKSSGKSSCDKGIRKGNLFACAGSAP